MESLIGQKISNRIAKTIGYFEDISSIVIFDLANWTVMSLLLFISYLRLIQSVTAIRRLSHFSVLMQQMCKTEMNFLIYFLIIFLVFCQIFYQLFFSRHESYKTFLATVNSLLKLVLGRNYSAFKVSEKNY